MRLDALQIATLILLVVGSALDFVTTEVLLSVGEVRVGDTIISFSEANPLFHILGHERFVAVYVLVTAALIALTVYAPRVVPRGTAHYQVALMVIACFGLAHLVLGVRNYLIIHSFFHSYENLELQYCDSTPRNAI